MASAYVTCGSNNDCYYNHKFISQRNAIDDYSMHKDNSYMFVDQETYYQYVVMHDLKYNGKNHVGEEFKIEKEKDGKFDIDKIQFSKVEEVTIGNIIVPKDTVEASLQTSLGNVKDLEIEEKRHRVNYYVVYAVVDLVNLEYTRKHVNPRTTKDEDGNDVHLPWRFSAQEVIDNIPKDDIYDVKTVLEYVDQNGLCLEEDYELGRCDLRYHIESFDKKNTFQNQGVYESLREQPLYVEVGLNHNFFQFHTPKSEHPVKAGVKEGPTFAGVLTGLHIEHTDCDTSDYCLSPEDGKYYEWDDEYHCNGKKFRNDEVDNQCSTYYSCSSNCCQEFSKKKLPCELNLHTNNTNNYWEMYIRRHGTGKNYVRLATRFYKYNEETEEFDIANTPFAGLSAKMYSITVPEKLPQPIEIPCDNDACKTNEDLKKRIQDTIDELLNTPVKDAQGAEDKNYYYDTTTIRLKAAEIGCDKEWKEFDLTSIHGISNVVVDSLLCKVNNTGVLIFVNPGTTRRLQDSCDGVNKKVVYNLRYSGMAVRSIVFANSVDYNGCNDYKVYINHNENLMSIFIGEGALPRARYLSISNNERLISANFGKESLSALQGWTDYIRSAEFYLDNINELEWLKFGDNSMQNFVYATVSNVTIADDMDFELIAGENVFTKLVNYYYSVAEGNEDVTNDKIENFFKNLDDNEIQTATPAPPTVAPHTEEPADDKGHLIVDKLEECQWLKNEEKNKGFVKITVKENMCNPTDGTTQGYDEETLNIVNFPHLTHLVIEPEALMGLKELIIMNNVNLESVTIGDESDKSSLKLAKITISNNPVLNTIKIGNNVASGETDDMSLLIENICKDSNNKRMPLCEQPSLTIGQNSFQYAKSVTIQNVAVDELMLSKDSFKYSKVMHLENLGTVDMPFVTLTAEEGAGEGVLDLTLKNLENLKSITAKNNAFRYTMHVTVEKVPFTEGNFEKKVNGFYTMQESGCAAVSFDETSKVIVSCLTMDTYSAELPEDCVRDDLLIVSKVDLCEDITLPKWKEIRVAPGICTNNALELTNTSSKLEIITFVGNAFPNANTLKIQGIPKLKEIVIRQNDLGVPFANVETLTISNNGNGLTTTYMELDIADINTEKDDVQGYFNKATSVVFNSNNMQELGLPENSFQAATTASFTSMEKLTTLTFGSESFTSVTEAHFETMKGLATLTFNKNAFKSVTSAYFKSMENLKTFNVNENCFANTIYMETNTPSHKDVAGNISTYATAFSSLKIYGVKYESKDQDMAFAKYILGEDVPDEAYKGVIVWNNGNCNQLTSCTGINCQFFIVVAECQTMTELTISNRAYLEYFAVGANALTKVTKLTFNKNVKLHTIVVGEGSLNAVTALTIENDKDTTAEGTPVINDSLKEVSFAKNTLAALKTVTLKNLEKLMKFEMVYEAPEASTQAETETEPVFTWDLVTIENVKKNTDATISVATANPQNVRDDNLIFDENSSAFAYHMYHEKGDEVSHIKHERKLNVNGDAGCKAINYYNWVSIVIEYDCAATQPVLFDANYAKLISLEVAGNKLTETPEFTIKSNDIQTIVIGEGALLVASLTLQDLDKCTTLTIGNGAFANSVKDIKFEGLVLTTMTIGEGAFKQAKSLSLEGLESLETLTIKKEAFYAATTISFKDLAAFKTFTVGEDAFAAIVNIRVSNTPFNGEGSKVEIDSDSTSFDKLKYGIYYEDDNDKRLPLCIINKSCEGDLDIEYGFLKKQGVLHFQDEKAHHEKCAEVLFDKEIKIWTEIILDDFACDEVEKELEIDGLEELKKIVIGKDALASVTKLTISNNKILESVETEAGFATESPVSLTPGEENMEYGSFYATTEVIIKDNEKLETFVFSKNTFVGTTSLTISGNIFESFSNGENCMPNLSSAVFADVGRITIHADTFKNVETFEIPAGLHTLNIGDNSLTKVKALNLADNTELKTLTIGKGNFAEAPIFSATVKKPEVEDSTQTLAEAETPTEAPIVSKIETITIGDGSFPVATEFVIDNLAALKTISIGNGCFATANKFNVDTVTATQFNELEIGDGCFTPAPAAEGAEVTFDFKFDLPATLTKFVVGANSMKYAVPKDDDGVAVALDFSGKADLTTIKMGNNAFTGASAIFNTIPEIQEFIIGDNVLTATTAALNFANTALTTFKVGSGNFNNVETFLIENNEALTELIIKNDCFYKVDAFNHHGNTGLTKLEIGDSCFETYSNSFELTGTSSLKEVYIGASSFTSEKFATNEYFKLDGFNSLEKLHIGDNSFTEISMILKNLPSLNNVTFGEKVFNGRGEGHDIENVPFTCGEYVGTQTTLNYQARNALRNDDSSKSSRLFTECIDKNGCQKPTTCPTN